MVLIADGRSRCGMTGFITPVAAPHFHGHHTIRLPNNTGGTRRTQYNMLRRRQQYNMLRRRQQYNMLQRRQQYNMLQRRQRVADPALPWPPHHTSLPAEHAQSAPGVASPCALMLLACPLPQAPGGSHPPPLPAAASPSHPSTGAAAGLHTPLQSQSLAASGMWAVVAAGCMVHRAARGAVARPAQVRDA